MKLVRLQQVMGILCIAAQRGPEPKTRTLADENAAHVTVNDH